MKSTLIGLMSVLWAASTTGPGIVIPGLEVLVAEQQSLIAGKRVGLITNHTGIDRRGNHSIDLISKVPGARLTALFAPEHGIRGVIEAGGNVVDTVDERSGVPVYSIYGTVQRPTLEMLKDVDILLFDIQDVGVRFYTFISTMGEGMEAAAGKGIPFVVLDRPDAVGGVRIEGPVLDLKFRSFVGAYPIPIRFGMTLGELAGFHNDRMAKKADLKVVRMKNWKRAMWYDQTGLPWVPPSPNIPTLASAAVYPGTCLIEGTNVSEGRGTTLPFELIGAPWIDGARLAEEMRKADLPGVIFRPAGFTPTFSKHQGQVCQGVQIIVMERDRFEAVRTGVHLIRAIKSLWPGKFEWRPSSIDRLSGTDRLRLAIDRGDSPETILASWEAALEEYDAVRRKYLLYE
jgi:uncharacterized protein YbbC (DUF1343 family)